MILIKLFRTAEMPEAIFQDLLIEDAIARDGIRSYDVGSYQEEAAGSDDPNMYDPESLERCRRIDDYLISQGANRGEEVIIRHG